MVFDWDDHHEGNTAWSELYYLKELRPDFKCTMFAVPALGNWRFWADTPPWIELAVHGWEHPSPHEAEEWTKEQMLAVMDDHLVQEFFVQGFKAPGWQISDGCYEALLERGWWVADQPYNDERRPAGLRCHRLGDGEHWHGHVQNVCGNGIRETFDQVARLVKNAESFEFVSEVVKAWQPTLAPSARSSSQEATSASARS